MKRLIKPIILLLFAACITGTALPTAFAQGDDARTLIAVADAAEIPDAATTQADMLRITPNTTTELAEIFSIAATKTILLDMNWEDRDAYYTAVKALQALDRCIFVCRTSAKKAVNWKNSLDAEIKFMVYEKTNIIFTAWACVRTLSSEPNGYLWLATSNPYGMIFKKAVTNGFSDLPGVMIQCTDPELCGKRADTETYWEDLLSRGYNMICTAQPEELIEYRKASDAARDNLKKSLEDIQNNWTLPNFSGKAFAEYKFAYNNALNEAIRLTECDFSGEAACKNAKYALLTAVENINNNYDALAEGTAGITATPGRIITAVIATVAFICLEWFMHKHRGKEKQIAV